MKKIFLSWCLVSALLLCGLTAFAQSGLISGTVKDATENRGLPGAALKLNKYNRYTISDQKGYFEFLNVPEGDYEIEIEYLGYEKAAQQVEVRSGRNNVVDFVLTESNISLNEVVVMGDMARGQARALNAQKTSDRISNVISADLIGRFPDSNIGDALKRVPGIAMQNDQGEARHIVIRGLVPALNSVTLNGNRIPSAEGDNRMVQLDLFPADMIQTVDVSKTLTPDMDADAIGSSVDLITRSAPDQQRISATILGGYNPIREGATYGGALVYGNRFFDKKLGVVLSASYQNKDYGSDNVEGVWAEEDGHIYMEEMDIRKYNVQRIRRSVTLNTDWKINASNTLTADVLYNWRDDLENRFRLGYEDVEPEFDDNGNLTGYTGNIVRENKGGFYNKHTKGARLEIQTVQSYALGGQHLISPKFDLDWKLSYAKSTEEARRERYVESVIEEVDDISQDLSNERLPVIKSLSSAKYDDYELDGLTENTDYTAEDELAFRLNMRVPFSILDDQKGRLRFGVRARIKSKERDNIFREYEPVEDFPTIGEQGVTFNESLSMSKDYIPGSFYKPEFIGKLDLRNESLFEGEEDPDEFLADNYTADERVLAAYLRWDQNFSSKLLMILGVRAEHTYMEYAGNIITFDDEGDYEGHEKYKTDNDYLNILPGLSFRYDVKDNMVLRAAFTTSLARPNYYDLVPFTNISIEDEEISAGNADLKPTYSYNFDLMGEYYFKSIGVFSIGAFYKHMNNFIYFQGNSSYSSSDFARDFPSLHNPIPDGEDGWEMVRPMNGESVAVYGFEVALQRRLDFFSSDFLKNFNVLLNYTYSNSKTKGIYNEDGEERTDVKLPGSAPHMFNASLSWENRRFSARVSANYSGKYIDEVGGDAFEDRYYDKQLFVDANASYKIKPFMRVFAEANNLTNQPLRYYQGAGRRLSQLEYYKPTYNFGIKFDF